MQHKLLLRRGRCLAVLATVSAVCLQGVVYGQSADPRPGYRFLRWTEDWSGFEPAAATEPDPFDGIKRVPLGSNGGAWASFGGDFRVRWEDWSGFNFGLPLAASHEDSFALTRFRLHGDFHLPESNRFFVELKGAYATDRNLPGGVRAIDEDKFELQQFFWDSEIELGGDAPLRLRLGRQQLAFGSQRLVSPLPWANALRTWDGARATFQLGDWNVDTFGVMFVPVDADGIGEAKSDQLLCGVYAKRPSDGGKGGTELYALKSELAGRSFNGTSGEDRRWTLGVRQWDKLGERGDYEFELSYQFGSLGSEDVSAWSIASKYGYQLKSDNSLKLWFGFDWASGDDEAGGKVKTFNQLYPLGHAYFGIADVIGRQNIMDTSVGLTWKALPQLTVNFAGHRFWADSTSDAIYNPGGGVVRAGGTFESSSIGWETDVSGKWKVSRHVAIDAGFAHFFPESAIEQSGPAEDVDFLYLGGSFTY